MRFDHFFLVVNDSDWSPIDRAALRECRYLDARYRHDGVRQQILKSARPAAVCVALCSSKLTAAPARAGGGSVRLSNQDIDALPSWPPCQLRVRSDRVRVIWFCFASALFYIRKYWKNFVTRCLLVALDEQFNMGRIREPSYWWILSFLILTLPKHKDCHPGKYSQPGLALTHVAELHKTRRGLWRKARRTVYLRV